MIGYSWEYCDRNGIPGYDAWKTRSPDDDRYDDRAEFAPDDEQLEYETWLDEQAQHHAELEQSQPGWATTGGGDGPIVSYWNPWANYFWRSYVVTPPILF